MAGEGTLLGAPRRRTVTLEGGTEVTIQELSIAAAWPYVQGGAVDPEQLIRQSVIDRETGAPAEVGFIPLAAALELLPHIMALNNLETNEDPDDGDGGAEDAPDFPRAAHGA